MTRSTKGTAGLCGIIAVVLAGGLLVLAPASQANPGMGGMGSSGGGSQKQKSGGCGSCGGGERTGPSASDERDRVSKTVANADAAEGGTSSSSVGRANEGMGGAITALGEAQAKADQEEARRRPSRMMKDMVLGNINAAIDADVSEEEAERLKGIARRAADIARSEEELMRVKQALDREIQRQKGRGVVASTVADMKEGGRYTKDIFWRNDNEAYGKGGALRDAGELLDHAGDASNAIIKGSQDLGDGAVNLAVDAARAAAGAPDAQRLIQERYDAASQATRDGFNKGVEMASGAASTVAGKFSDAARDTRNLITNPHLRGLAADEAQRQANALATDVSQAFDENDTPQRSAAEDRLIQRLPGGDQYLKGTQNPDMPIGERVIHTTLGTAQAVGTAAVVAQGVTLGTAAVAGLRGAGTAAAGATTEVAVANAGAEAAAASVAGEAAVANVGGQAVVGRVGQQVVGRVGQQVVGRVGGQVGGRAAGAGAGATTQPAIAGAGATTETALGAATPAPLNPAGVAPAVGEASAARAGSTAASGAGFEGAKTIP